MTIIICIARCCAVGRDRKLMWSSNWLGTAGWLLPGPGRQWRDPSVRLPPSTALVPPCRRLLSPIYRYVMPLIFAAVGAARGYYLFIADPPAIPRYCG